MVYDTFGAEIQVFPEEDWRELAGSNGGWLFVGNVAISLRSLLSAVH